MSGEKKPKNIAESTILRLATNLEMNLDADRDLVTHLKQFNMFKMQTDTADKIAEALAEFHSTPLDKYTSAMLLALYKDESKWYPMKETLLILAETILLNGNFLKATEIAQDLRSAVAIYQNIFDKQ